MISLGRGATNLTSQHSINTPKAWGLIKNPMHPMVLDVVMASMIDQHSLRTPREVYKTSSGVTSSSNIVNKNDKPIKLVDRKALDGVVLDEDLASESFDFRILLMVTILLLHFVKFTWIRCPHEPATFDMKHHTAGLHVYMNQSHSCNQRSNVSSWELPLKKLCSE